MEKSVVSGHSGRLRHALHLLWALAGRDVRARYRKSFLGPAWALIQPLVYMVVFTLLRGVVKISSEGIPYSIFTFAALVPWTFFSNAVVSSAPSVVTNASIIKKIAVPREIFPLSAVTTALFDLLMSGLVLAGLMIYYRVSVGCALLWLPILITLTALLAFGVGMLLAAFGTFRRDLVMAAPFLMQFWLFVSPVLYPLSQVPDKWRKLYMLNPTVGLIEGFRNVLLRAQPPALEPLFWSAIVIGLLLTLTWPMFRWISQYFADAV
jgi:ABC-type polysaccharide/polyol phosphate export permease